MNTAKYTRGEIRKVLLRKRTKAEIFLSNLLRNKFIWQFEEQKPIGNYFVDFWFPAFGLAVELDGGIHEKQISYDSVRDGYIKSRSADFSITFYDIIRFDNDMLFKFPNEVLTAIGNAIEIRVSRIRQFGRYKRPVKIKHPDGGFHYEQRARNSKDLRHMERELIYIEKRKHFLAHRRESEQGQMNCSECNNYGLRGSFESYQNGIVKWS